MQRTSIFLAAVLTFVFITGCSGTYGKLRATSGENRKARFQALKDNLADYYIYQCRWLTALDPKNDAKTIEMTGPACKSVNPQEASYFDKKYWVPEVKEVLGPDDQRFGYILIWSSQKVSAGAVLVAENSMRVYVNYAFTDRR